MTEIPNNCRFIAICIIPKITENLFFLPMKQNIVIYVLQHSISNEKKWVKLFPHNLTPNKQWKMDGWIDGDALSYIHINHKSNSNMKS